MTGSTLSERLRAFGSRKIRGFVDTSLGLDDANALIEEAADALDAQGREIAEAVVTSGVSADMLEVAADLLSNVGMKAVGGAMRAQAAQADSSDFLPSSANSMSGE